MKFSVDNLKNVLDKDKIGDWIVKYKRQVAVGCVAFCLVVFAGAAWQAEVRLERRGKPLRQLRTARARRSSREPWFLRLARLRRRLRKMRIPWRRTRIRK